MRCGAKPTRRWRRSRATTSWRSTTASCLRPSAKHTTICACARRATWRCCCGWPRTGAVSSRRRRSRTPRIRWSKRRCSRGRRSRGVRRRTKARSTNCTPPPTSPLTCRRCWRRAIIATGSRWPAKVRPIPTRCWRRSAARANSRAIPSSPRRGRSLRCSTGCCARRRPASKDRCCSKPSPRIRKRSRSFAVMARTPDASRSRT